MTQRSDQQGHVGSEVRAAREALGLSTRQLAARIGTSQPFVSNIENARIFPSLRTLGLLAEALDIPIARLLHGSERTERIGASTAMRRRGASEPAARRVLGAADRVLEVWRIELRPGEREPRPFAHDGEDYVLAISGALVLLREGLPPVTLAAGDSVWIDGTVPHRLAAPDDAVEPGVALVVVAVVSEGRSTGVAHPAPQSLDASVGSAVRAVRLRRRLSTRALARLAGVSQPLLSKIENGRSLPSVHSLYAIAEALGVGPADFLPRGDDTPVTGGHGMPLPANEADAPADATTLLLHAAPGRSIEAYRIDQVAGFTDPLDYHHSGEDVIHVLEGQATLHCGGTRLRLGPGDTAWIDGTTPHSFTTPSASGVSALIVTVR